METLQNGPLASIALEVLPWGFGSGKALASKHLSAKGAHTPDAFVGVLSYCPDEGVTDFRILGFWLGGSRF